MADESMLGPKNKSMLGPSPITVKGCVTIEHVIQTTTAISQVGGQNAHNHKITGDVTIAGSIRGTAKIKDNLITFRTAYLRAIARAWADNAFKDALIQNAINAMGQLGFKWPWTEMCDLEIKRADNLRWRCNDWAWPSDVVDKLILKVPLNPNSKNIAANMQAVALADFYRQRSALFSDGWGEDWIPQEADAELPLDPSGYYRGAGGLYPAASEFPEFQVALLAAIAKAWVDPDVRTLLQENAKAVLRTIRGYDLPWDMQLEIADDQSASWTEETKWQNFQKNKLILNLPSKPDGATGLRDEPLALAMYNGTGAAYPFSCTC